MSDNDSNIVDWDGDEGSDLMDWMDVDDDDAAPVPPPTKSSRSVASVLSQHLVTTTEKKKKKKKKEAATTTAIPKEARVIMDSYVGADAHLEEIHSRQWNEGLPAPVRRATTPRTRVKLLDEVPQESHHHHHRLGQSTVAAMDPRVLDEKNRDISNNFSRMIDEAGAKQLLAIDRETLTSNAKATEFIKNLIQQYQTVFSTKYSSILSSTYKPTTTAHGFPLPTLPILSRADTVPYLRAAVPALDERPCKDEERCRAHQVFETYRMRTAGNPESGPQFPPRTASFPLVEFHLPHVREEIDTKRAQGVPMATILSSIPRQLCLFCIYSTTCHLAARLAQNVDELQEPSIVQPFGVIVGKPGEYASNAQLLCGTDFHGLIAPFPEFRFTNYVPFKHDVDENSNLTALGWAECDNIICKPSNHTQPRGDTLYTYVPPPSLR